MSPFSRSGSFIFLADSQPVPPELPEQIAARLREDAVAAKLAARVLHWLPAAGYAQLGLFEGATFRLRMRGNFLAAPGYLLRLSFSPTEEDWQTSGKGRGSETGFSMPSAAPSGCLPVASV
jgi:hypothetical protein